MHKIQIWRLQRKWQKNSPNHDLHPQKLFHHWKRATSLALKVKLKCAYPHPEIPIPSWRLLRPAGREAEDWPRWRAISGKWMQWYQQLHYRRKIYTQSSSRNACVGMEGNTSVTNNLHLFAINLFLEIRFIHFPLPIGINVLMLYT